MYILFIVNWSLYILIVTPVHFNHGSLYILIIIELSLTSFSFSLWLKINISTTQFSDSSSSSTTNSWIISLRSSHFWHGYLVSNVLMILHLQSDLFNAHPFYFDNHWKFSFIFKMQSKLMDLLILILWCWYLLFIRFWIFYCSIFIFSKSLQITFFIHFNICCCSIFEELYLQNICYLINLELIVLVHLSFQLLNV